MATKEPVPDARDVHSSIYFLERNEIFASVKPYTLAYKPEPGVARENYKREARNLTISDIRACRGDMSLDRNGFIVLDTAELSDTLNWDDKTCVEREYYPAIVAAIEKVLPGASFIPLHHQIRKRSPDFPASTEDDYTHEQPILAAHTNLVRSSAEQLVQGLPAEQAQSISKKRYMIANVWQPLHGPNDDYPLALCDLATIDLKNDVEVADYVTPDLSLEHCLVYANENQRWWYLSRQKTTEALFFVQYDSEKGDTPGVPHASFMNPLSSQQRPRESIETAVLIWYD